MIETPFRLTENELICSSAATLCLQALAKAGTAIRSVSELAEKPQYGYTASATSRQTSTRFLRITDVKGGTVDWASVPFCECDQPGSYLLKGGDILVARSGSVGKTFLVGEVPERTVFASYMIRLRAKGAIVPAFLYCCLQSQQFWQQVVAQKRGSAMANINGPTLSALEFPIPNESVQAAVSTFLANLRMRLNGHATPITALPEPLAAIPDVVARIEELARQIAEARDLRQRSIDEVQLLCRSILSHGGEATLTPLTELVTLRAPDVQVEKDEEYQFAGVYSFGRGVFRASKKAGTDFAYRRLTRLRERNFVYPKLMAWEGALGIVPPECDGCVVSTEFPVFEVLEDKVLPEVLDVHFKTPSVWPAISGASTGTNVRRRRLNPQDFLAYKMPLPSRATQERLRKVMESLRPVHDFQAKTTTELRALLPAILDRALNGKPA